MDWDFIGGILATIFIVLLVLGIGLLIYDFVMLEWEWRSRCKLYDATVFVYKHQAYCIVEDTLIPSNEFIRQHISTEEVSE